MAAREVAVASLGTVYAIEGGKDAADKIGQILGEMEPFDSIGATRPIRVRASMCIDAGRHTARDG